MQAEPDAEARAPREDEEGSVRSESVTHTFVGCIIVHRTILVSCIVSTLPRWGSSSSTRHVTARAAAWGLVRCPVIMSVPSFTCRRTKIQDALGRASSCEWRATRACRQRRGRPLGSQRLGRLFQEGIEKRRTGWWTPGILGWAPVVIVGDPTAMGTG